MPKPPIAILPKLQPQPAEPVFPAGSPAMSASADPTAIHSHSREKANKLAQKQALRARRKHVLRACDRCRAKKTKCDGEQPCNRCAAHNDPCLFRKKKTLQPRIHSRGFMEMMELKHDLLVKGLQLLWTRIIQYEASLAGEPIEMIDGWPHVHGILDRLGLIKEAEEGEDSDDDDDDDEGDAMIGSAGSWTMGHQRSVSTTGLEEYAKVQHPADANWSHKRSLSAADSENLSRMFYPHMDGHFDAFQQQQQEQTPVAHHHNSVSVKVTESDNLSAQSVCSPPSLATYHSAATHELPVQHSSPAIPGGLEAGLKQQQAMPLYNVKTPQPWTTGNLDLTSNFAFAPAPLMTDYVTAAQQQPQQQVRHQPAVTQLAPNSTSNIMAPSIVAPARYHQQAMLTGHQTDNNLLNIMPDMTYTCSNQGVWCSM